MNTQPKSNRRFKIRIKTSPSLPMQELRNFKSWLFARKSLCRRKFRNDLSYGTTAFVPALVVSGLPNHDFILQDFYLKKGTNQTETTRRRKNHRFLYKPHKINTTL